MKRTNALSKSPARMVSKVHGRSTACSSAFPAKETTSNRAYLSAQTWNMIQQRQTARIQGRTDQEQKLNREIKKHAKADKLRWIIQKLDHLTDSRTAWKQICV